MIDSLHINLKNCHGIRRMDELLSFSKHGRHAAIYASNGTMKSSLAKTLRDVSRGEKPRDHIYTHRISSCNITTGGGEEGGRRDIERDHILVIDPYEDVDISKAMSSGILVSEDLRSRYEAARSSIVPSRKALLDKLHSLSGIPRKRDQSTDTVEEAAVTDLAAFRSRPSNSAAAGAADQRDGILDILGDIDNMQLDPQNELAGIKYHDVFNEKTKPILESENFREAVDRYIEKYEKLIAAALYLRTNFDHLCAEAVSKSLGGSGFFGAGHSLNMKEQDKEDQKTVSTSDELRAILDEDMKRVYKDLDKEWNAMDKLLARPKEAAALKECLLANKWLIHLLGNLPLLKARFWKSYLEAAAGLAGEALAKYRAGRDEMEDVVSQAAKQRTRWEEVVRIFRGRFDVPFEPYIEDKPLAVIKAKAPRLMYRFHDSDDEEDVRVEREQLDEHLSTGEKRAFYLLNVLFEVERRRAERMPTLLVLDDVVDSFDYKNKYAVIEYLKDLSDDGLFQLLILTHNFDFFRTIVGRCIVNYGACWFANVNDVGHVTLEQAGYIKNPLNDITKDMKFPRQFIAAIPFARNMIEYSQGTGHPYYRMLSDAMHWRSGTDKIKTSEVWDILCNTFPKRGGGNGCEHGARGPPSQSETVYEMLIAQADEISCYVCPKAEAPTCRQPDSRAGNATSQTGVAGLYDKITLSVAIRVLAERFLICTLHGSEGAGLPPRRLKLPLLIKEYKKLLPKSKPPLPDGGDGGNDGGRSLPPDPLATLEKVALMTPEAIHLNSFMYEPILDMSGQHLAELYKEVRGLDGQADGR